MFNEYNEVVTEVVDSKYPIPEDAATTFIINRYNQKAKRHEWIDGELFGFDDCNVFHGTKHTGDEPRIIMLVDILKSAVQPYAKHWPVRENIPRNKRTIPTIQDW